jgi:hypothetical protein
MVVTWSRLPADRARGTITQHQILYKRQHSLEPRTIDVEGDVYEYIITG